MPVTRDSAKYIHSVANEHLVGAKIVNTEWIDDTEGWWGLHILTESGQELLVTPSCDEEGNGPGWLFIEEAG